MRDISISRERKVITYSHLWHTANVLYNKSIKEKKGSFHTLLSSIVFSAFTLESFLNHAGKETIPHWDEFESLSPKSKLLLIADKHNTKITTAYRYHLGGFTGFI